MLIQKSGGDGLVAARHLWHYGYRPTVYYPKQGKNELYQVSFSFCLLSRIIQPDHLNHSMMIQIRQPEDYRDITNETPSVSQPNSAISLSQSLMISTVHSKNLII